MQRVQPPMRRLLPLKRIDEYLTRLIDVRNDQIGQTFFRCRTCVLEKQPLMEDTDRAVVAQHVRRFHPATMRDPANFAPPDVFYKLGTAAPPSRAPTGSAAKPSERDSHAAGELSRTASSSGAILERYVKEETVLAKNKSDTSVLEQTFFCDICARKPDGRNNSMRKTKAEVRDHIVEAHLDKDTGQIVIPCSPLTPPVKEVQASRKGAVKSAAGRLRPESIFFPEGSSVASLKKLAAQGTLFSMADSGTTTSTETTSSSSANLLKLVKNGPHKPRSPGSLCTSPERASRPSPSSKSEPVTLQASSVSRRTAFQEPTSKEIEIRPTSVLTDTINSFVQKGKEVRAARKTRLARKRISPPILRSSTMPAETIAISEEPIRKKIKRVKSSSDKLPESPKKDEDAIPEPEEPAVDSDGDSTIILSETDLYDRCSDLVCESPVFLHRVVNRQRALSTQSFLEFDASDLYAPFLFCPQRVRHLRGEAAGRASLRRGRDFATMDSVLDKIKLQSIRYAVLPLTAISKVYDDAEPDLAFATSFLDSDDMEYLEHCSVLSGIPLTELMGHFTPDALAQAEEDFVHYERMFESCYKALITLPPGTLSQEVPKFFSK